MGDCKWDIFDEISEKKEINHDELLALIDLSRHQDDEIRSFVAELLCLNDSMLSKQTLMELSHDNDYLVRANACDSLGIFDDNDIVELLLEKAEKDPDKLVRCYASLSLSDIAVRSNNQDTFVKIFLRLLKKASSVNTRLPCYQALYLLGEEEYFDKIIVEVSGKRYQNRCFAVNSLLNIINTNNKSKIIDILKIQQKKEKTVAVLSSISNVLSRI